jgi:GMP synthase (glutamine-hydrolysing)
MPMPSRHALVLSHVAFENLGSLEVPLRERGFAIETVDAATARFPLPQAERCDLLVVLGGPIGVYDRQEYPFLNGEIACIGARLAAHRPILGICLGAQLMAAALGARVYAGEHGAEIGWGPIEAATDQADSPDWFAPLLTPGLSLFHWHGDTFDLPQGAVHLAKTDRYINQSFTSDNFALALQFHPEVTANGLERWYVGHACELRHAGISVEDLRADALRFAPALEEAAARFWSLWLDSVLQRPISAARLPFRIYPPPTK